MSEVSLLEYRGTLMETERIVRWRNDSINASAFPKQEPWTEAGQFTWYNEVYRKDPSLNLYWVCVDGEPIGTVGMKITSGAGEMMWMILGNKDLARKGYMRQGMRMLMESYGLTYYWGRVLTGNEPGLRFQLRNGFSVYKESGEFTLIHRFFDGTYPLEAE